MDWALSLSGFLVGTLVGMTGVGGGALMTPLLVLFFGVHPAAAVGTDLLFAAATKSVGTICHGFNRNVDWRIAGRLAAGSVPMTILTVAVLHSLRLEGGLYNRMITLVLAGVLAVTALTLIFHGPIRTFAERRGRSGPAPLTVTLLTIVAGAVLGVVVTISSVGTGAIGMTVLVFLYPRVPPSRLVGADVAHAVPLTLLAGLGHWYLGSINWTMLSSLLLGSIPGVVLGSYLALRVPASVLRFTLAAVLLIVARQLAMA